MAQQVDRFTESARKVLEASEQRARREGAKEIAPRHILGAMPDVPQSIAAQVLGAAGIARISATPNEDWPLTASSARVPLNPMSRRVVEYAVTQAQQQSRRDIDTGYLLLGLITEAHLSDMVNILGSYAMIDRVRDLVSVRRDPSAQEQ